MKKLKVSGEIKEVQHGPWRYETKGFKKTGYGEFISFDVEYDRDKWDRRVGIEYLTTLGFIVEDVVVTEDEYIDTQSTNEEPPSETVTETESTLDDFF